MPTVLLDLAGSCTAKTGSMTGPVVWLTWVEADTCRLAAACLAPAEDRPESVREKVTAPAGSARGDEEEEEEEVDGAGAGVEVEVQAMGREEGDMNRRVRPGWSQLRGAGAGDGFVGRPSQPGGKRGASRGEVEGD